MNKYFVSVLILNFNNAKYLNRSIKSCINQSYKKIEVLVYDDKSTDCSVAILKKYKKEQDINNWGGLILNLSLNKIINDFRDDIASFDIIDQNFTLTKDGFKVDY